ncbi:class II bacteriocin [Pediococcus pentosaceus]|uniref:class II bacteriocin n=1 Tax=Pediococcus pentosaceus TaxID=1255 RepID=UPI0018A1A52E|nr:class II bacteriocin [Pediococcus pentosaceus]MBF7102138.1 class II bacteriocin [Pediococcus pentosaceus]
MTEIKVLNDKELKNVVGGKYYDNGVHCGKKTCYVDWGQATASIGKIIVNGWTQHGPWAHR